MDNLKIIRANQILQNMYLMPVSNREATFQDDYGHRVPIKVDFKTWPKSILLNYYVSSTYSPFVFGEWVKRAADVTEPIERALILVDVIDETIEKNKILTEGWDNERDDRDFR
jgi:hypothetical protein